MVAYLTARCAKLAAVAVVLTVQAGLSQAAPSLDELLAAARRSDLDVRELSAVVDERAAAERVAAAGLWPRLTIVADYLRNQHAVIVDLPGDGAVARDVTIQPRDQLDATLQVEVPLVELAARRRLDAARLDVDAARAGLEVTALEIERDVVRAYYQWAGAGALLVSTRAAYQAAVDDATVVSSRLGAGLAVELDVVRARAQVARATQTIAEAELAVANARRELRTLTGIDVAGEAPALPDSTSAEPPLASWLAGADTMPELVRARAEARASAARVSAERRGYAPALGLIARERFTNGAGFGTGASWTVGVTATWALDREIAARIDQSAAVVATAQIRISRAGAIVRDRIVDAWNQVEALRARSAAATAGRDAAHVAAQVAAGKLAAGQASHLDLVLARRDALDAEVVLTQARADLAVARAELRLAVRRL